jgi:predicted DNA-binding WGR domain protein
MEHITLYFRQGSSDKVYQASIEPADGGHVVHFAYGRRGTTLQTGTKTNTPVPHHEAKRIYDKLIAEKTAKGYTPGADGTPYAGTDKAGQTTGIHCQLLNAIDEPEVETTATVRSHFRPTLATGPVGQDKAIAPVMETPVRRSCQRVATTTSTTVR